MSRKTQLVRSRMAACANYWRNHIAKRSARTGPCKAPIPTALHQAKPTDNKPGPAA